MWTLGGRYLQTIGTFTTWKKIDPDGQSLPEDFNYTIPPDIKRIASSTTFKVLSGGSFPKRLTIKQLQKQAQKDLICIDHVKIYGTRLKDPILGHYYNTPERTTSVKNIRFDTTFPYFINTLSGHSLIQSWVVPDVPEGVSSKNIRIEEDEI